MSGSPARLIFWRLLPAPVNKLCLTSISFGDYLLPLKMSDDWEIACSEDEKYDVKLTEYNKWEPPAEEILKLYEELDKGSGILELAWKCPGRRPPTPEKVDTETEEPTTPENKEEEKDYNFDFDVDKGQLQLRPSGEVGPRGSAKKKTTSLDAILSNMARHRRMDMMEETPADVQQS